MKQNLASKLAITALLVMAALWGSTMVVIKDTLERLPATDMLAVRFSIAAAVLVVFAHKYFSTDMRTIRQAVVLGLCFAGGQFFQTVGLQTTSASVSGFLTGTYVIFTPLIAGLVFGTHIRRNVWTGVGLATVGMAALSIMPSAASSSFGIGELLTLLGALCYGAQIVFTGMFATRENAMSLTVWQAVVLAAVCVVMATPGGITMPATLPDWGAVLYLAILCGSVTLFLQNWAQAHVDATKAAVIMCTEPVWAAIIAVAVGFEPLTARMVVGGLAIMGAMLMVVAPPRGRAAVAVGTPAMSRGIVPAWRRRRAARLEYASGLDDALEQAA